MGSIENIKALDGKQEGIYENPEGILDFLRKRGKGKDVLLDEVPLTLGFHGHMDDKKLSEQWTEICNPEKSAKSLTIAFRPNDATYTRDINLETMKIGGASMNTLNVVKRNTIFISELFLALADYSRRIFVSKEPTLRDMEFCQSNKEFVPTLFPIPSCPTIHNSCKNISACEAVRASVAILMIRESSGNEKPLYAVVDSEERRNRLVNTLAHVFNTEVTWMDSSEIFHGPPNSSIIVFTDAQILGCHEDCEFVIMDLADCKWRNYIRIVSSCFDNVTIVMEQEALRTGKYQYLQIKMSMPAFKENSEIDQEVFLKALNGKMEKAWKLSAGEIAHLDEKRYSSKMIISMNNTTQSSSPIKWKKSKLKVIFGPPSSGKSMSLFDSIQKLAKKNSGGEMDQILLLHMGGPLSWKVSLDYLRPNAHKLHVLRSEPCAPKDLIDDHQLEVIRWKYPDSNIHIHVDDYLVQAQSTKEEIQNWTKVVDALKENEQNMTLTVVFQSHSICGRVISMKELSSSFKVAGAQVIITSAYETLCCQTSGWLLNHIRENETQTHLRLEAKSLPTASRPGAIVHGLKPKYITMNYHCGDHHLSYSCKGQNHCMSYVGAFLCFRFALTQAINEKLSLVPVLISDGELMSALEAFSGNHVAKLQFLHPKDFRGCEAKACISVNVEDSWLLESVSRARTDLYIIDCLQDHQHVWQTMLEEGRLEEIVIPEDYTGLDEPTLMRLNSIGNFLRLDVYKMTSIPRGQALVMNIDTFEHGHNMKGSDVDKTEIETLLRDKLHFEVTVEENLRFRMSEERIEKVPLPRQLASREDAEAFSNERSDR
ncbi:unnamed protein product [Darwinula stevensoni]|uniref:Uncharacterized protein n=1 Tax=Darwinula stevensoni TaxID=69355 RepID=A0A7R8X9G2_9CRUS|nr:unnamed protein product [Darwinula stevensoni]CAG0884497.1 unnamed protein product [Darwinula stevensoni]